MTHQLPPLEGCNLSRASTYLVRTGFPSNMPMSKSFLLVLFLATVACIVVLQISLDSWMLNTTRINTLEQSRDTAGGLEYVIPQPIQNQVPIATKQSSAAKITFPKFENVMKQFNQNRTWRKLKNYELNISKLQNLSYKGYAELVTQRVSASKLSELQMQQRQSQFNKNAMKAVQLMPAIKPQNVTRVFLLTYFRSGSSFLGELLQQNWKTFYQFEPFHFMSMDSRLRDDQVHTALNVLQNIYHCNFQNLTAYLDWIQKPNNKFLFKWSRFLMMTCRGRTELCFNPEFVSAVCNHAPVQIIKGVRLHMSQLKMFLEYNRDLNIKVVYLTRDPRGTLSSRWHLMWCSNSRCLEPQALCNEMEEDMRIFQELQKQAPENFIHVQYETLAQNPNEEANKIFRFLKLPFSKSIKTFLRTHTTARQNEHENPYTTKRNSSATAFSWKQRLNFQQVQWIQESCDSVIDTLNQTLITSPLQLGNQNTMIDAKQPELNILNSQPFVNELDLPMGVNKSSNPLYNRLQGALS